MKKFSLTNLVALITIFSVLLMLFSGCNQETKNEDKKSEDLLPQKISQSDYQNILQNGRFTLSINPKTMGVEISDKKRGVSWSSNSSQIQNNDELNAQLWLSFMDKKGNYSTMNSYTDCVSRNQATVHKKGDTLYVRYELGDFTLTAEILPERISAKRFEEKILKKLNEEDAEEMKRYYKYYESNNIWAIRTRGKNEFMRVYELFQSIGYTEEDIAQDNAMFGIPTTSLNRPHFVIVLKYTLNQDGFTVSVPAGMIEYPEDYMPYQMKVLELFGVENRSDDGYIFVPDGCGGLIQFREKEEIDKDKLSLSVYGSDLTVTTSAKITQRIKTMPVTLPVFGMKDGKEAFFAVIEDGQATANIEAYRKGSFNQYNAVYPMFTIINKDNVYLEGGMQISKIPQFQRKIYDGEFATRYFILDDNTNDYNAMAGCYREYLKRNHTISKIEDSGVVPFYVETIGGVKGYKSFCGISYIGIKSATSYQENIEIVKALKSNGIDNLQLILRGWFNDGVNHQYPNSIHLLSQLGGKKSFYNLLSYADQNNTSLFMDVNLMTVSKKGNGFSISKHASKTLDMLTARVNKLSYASNEKRADDGLSKYTDYILKPSVSQELTETFLDKFSEFKTGSLYMRTSGSQLYSDFSRNKSIDRNTSMRYSIKSLSNAKEQLNKIIISNGNSYALKYATDIIDVPMSSSEFNLVNTDIPFIQMVLHGYINMSGSPLNLSSNSSYELLKAIEYGTGIRYQVTYKPSYILKNTDFTDNYSSYYKDWLSQMVEYNKEINTALKAVTNSDIVKYYKVSDTAACTEYENGIKIYVNYGDEAIDIDGVSVPSMGYSIR